MGALNMRFYAPMVNGLVWLAGTPCSCIGSPLPILPKSGRLSAAGGSAQLSPASGSDGSRNASAQLRNGFAVPVQRQPAWRVRVIALLARGCGDPERGDVPGWPRRR